MDTSFTVTRRAVLQGITASAALVALSHFTMAQAQAEPTATAATAATLPHHKVPVGLL